MSDQVMAAVLLGALLHATWNALLRSSSDRTRDVVLVVAAAALLSLPALAFLPLPAQPSWPWLAASGAIHVVYFLLVAHAYRHAELSFAYPLMRGLAPAGTAALAALLLAEWPPAAGWLGVALICGGVLLMAGDSWRSGGLHGRALLFPLATAGTIVIYTVIDGQGARLAGNVFAYNGWLFVLVALPLLLLFIARDGRATATYLCRHWPRGLLGGFCTLASYGLALWAMSQAPIALVAALRETSVVFGALIAAVWLGERVARLRWIAIGLVCAGAMAIRLA
jgi:drug/metabolite transporter (DMT)-like permease